MALLNLWLPPEAWPGVKSHYLFILEGLSWTTSLYNIPSQTTSKRALTMEASHLQPIRPSNSLPDHFPDTVQEAGLAAPAGPRTIALGLTRGYTSDWQVPDALRELYQNWKDTILQIHPQISLMDFQPKHSITGDQSKITYVVNCPASDSVAAGHSSVLGYIRFNIIHGRIEFATLGTTLHKDCLELGNSTKKGNNSRLAGGHGEGLKLAALVLSRQNHHIKISTNGCHWTFNFNGRNKTNFYCRIAPSKAKRKTLPVDAGAEPPRLSTNIWNNVCVTIEKGTKEQRLSFADFRAWVDCTVDLHPSSNRIRTAKGDLLLNPEYQDHIFLKGIRVSQRSLDAQPFHCGYVLIHGSVDRDRQRLVNPIQARECIHAIWQKAINEDKAQVLPRYLKLFLTHPLPADMQGAEYQVTDMTARKLWGVLQRDARAGNIFYCRQSRLHADILQKHGLLRGPVEELRHRLQYSEAVEVPQTAGAQGVAQTLRGLLALHASTARTQVVFVRSQAQVVDVAYRPDSDLLYIHKRWLQTPSGEASGKSFTDKGALVGLQNAEEVYQRAITIIHSSITKGAFFPDAAVRNLMRKAHQKLREMPRLIRLQQTVDGPTVFFTTGHGLDFAELCGTQVHYLVTLHRAKCRITGGLLYNLGQDTCQYPRQVIPLSTRKAVFPGLSGGSWTPVVCKAKGLDERNTGSGGPSYLQSKNGALIGTSFTACLPLSTPEKSPSAEAGFMSHWITPTNQLTGSGNYCRNKQACEPRDITPKLEKKTRDKHPNQYVEKLSSQSTQTSHDIADERMTDVTNSVNAAVEVSVNRIDQLTVASTKEPPRELRKRRLSDTHDTNVTEGLNRPGNKAVEKAINSPSNNCPEYTDKSAHKSDKKKLKDFVENLTEDPIGHTLDIPTQEAPDIGHLEHAHCHEVVNGPIIKITMHNVVDTTLESGRPNDNNKSGSEIQNIDLGPSSLTAILSRHDQADSFPPHEGTSTESDVNDPEAYQINRANGIDGCLNPQSISSPGLPRDKSSANALERHAAYVSSTDRSSRYQRAYGIVERSSEQLCKQMAGASIARSLQADKPLQRCVDKLGKGRYAIMTFFNRSHHGRAKRIFLHIHNVLEPASKNEIGPRLLVTKYSFLAEHPMLGAESACHRDDAELINTSDMLVVETDGDTPAIPYTVIPPCAGIPAVGYFVRFGVQDSLQPEFLFVTTLQSVRDASNGPALPQFAPLPAATVVNLTPDYLDLTVGFARSGYRIRAAMNFDENRNQAWKVS
ncbi:hypothetical protein BP00DRAFT_472717 [Aspergillus indologenus CBS 114.80]|uniref:Uncharacterized protein n=1 Tax=Aspergillus indologenus CBS 114.80 TaxID=1450541 RepID=A0A2V5IQM4_9EURO|nr:hypothetical protein BP00DRAFT_472717 [Aspergillus indologenus CBS 114.80]